MFEIQKIQTTELSQEAQKIVEKVKNWLVKKTVGLEDDGVATIPEIKIAQAGTTDPLKPDKAKLGDMFSTRGEYIGKSLRIILFYAHRQRELRNEENKIVCYSIDGKMGREGECRVCPKRQECKLQLHFYGITEDGKTYRIRMARTNLSVGFSIWRVVNALEHIYDRLIVLGTNQVTDPKEGRSWYVYRLDGVEEYENEDLKSVAAILTNLMAEARKAEKEKFVEANIPPEEEVIETNDEEPEL